MGSITTMTVFVWTLNVLIFLSQAAMISINPDSILFYSNGNSLLKQSSIGGNLTPNSNAIASELNPGSSEGAQEGETGIWFIDVISSTKRWFSDKLDYFTNIVLGPYYLIKSIPGIPVEFVGAISLIWYGVSILLLVLTIFGRNT